MQKKTEKRRAILKQDAAAAGCLRLRRVRDLGCEQRPVGRRVGMRERAEGVADDAALGIEPVALVAVEVQVVAAFG